MQPNQFIDAFVTWASGDPSIHAVLLVGSCARGAERPDSDVDLLILGDASTLLSDSSWVLCFGSVRQFALEDYGAVTSIRVHYQSGLEVEYGIARDAWASAPLDPGTLKVLNTGYKALWDPKGLLTPLA